MSDLMRMHHTEIAIDGSVFVLPKGKKKSAIELLEKMGATLKIPDNVKAKDVFAHLYKKTPKGALHLRAARLKEGLSQKDLMVMTGIEIPNISKMENGSRPIGKDIASRIAKVLNINAKLLLQK